MDQNLKISLTTLTTSLSNQAKRANTRADKHYLHTIVQGVGTDVGKGIPGFNLEDFLTECGVSPEWATIAA